MVRINGIPILGHLIYSLQRQGIEKFYVAVGYKGEVIKSWVAGEGLSHRVEIVETGLNSSTAYRVQQLLQVADVEQMLVTYGDGLSDLSVKRLLFFHDEHGKLATVTAVHPPARFGHLSINEDRVTSFNEKQQVDEAWISGGYFILERKVKNYIVDVECPFEVGALPQLAREGNLMAYKHNGFWKPMDTLRDKNELEILAKGKLVPWLI
jgi:glucose-1-phosphate cytidylyltransferase